MTSSLALFERVYWFKHREYWKSDGNNGVIFAPGTPQRVIDSYNLWKTNG